MAGPEKIRVLIVDDIAETRDNLKRMLSFDQGIEVVESGRTGKEAVDLIPKIKSGCCYHGYQHAGYGWIERY